MFSIRENSCHSCLFPFPALHRLAGRNDNDLEVNGRPVKNGHMDARREPALPTPKMNLVLGREKGRKPIAWQYDNLIN
jgi:hypothetical protein